MADIDMIPRSYQEAVRVRRTLAGYGIALAGLLLLGAGGSALLRWRVAQETPRLQQLRVTTAEAEALRGRVAAAELRKAALVQEAAALSALRGVGAIAALGGALDGALNDRVWFEQLQFSRTQELLRDPQAGPGSGPGVVSTRAVASGGAPQNWRLASHVEIAGQALDLPAMTTFLAAMSANPAVADMRLINSTTSTNEGGQLVSFSIAGSLRPGAGQ